ncbi:MULTISPECIES: YaaL family protein [Heyndrickxia]|uniref:YaaL family protein n=1 Tax=Heyndrickxia coagulans TaxID=1398 RepID=A0AAW7CN76_HEYCO|nr:MULTISPECIES: YaaL family protein [Heyndrickxia]MDL5041481.1 YaaL family protein [Heyndrickxia coagulans]MDT9754689.1 YaaL family protein [Heyndrickxia coagulans]MED4977627.1 YaaL family protein [Weizmannia sp. CD-2023]
MFSKKQKLRKAYDALLLDLVTNVKNEWVQQNALQNLSFEFNEELYCRTKVAEAKYVFLFREVKRRNIRLQ